MKISLVALNSKHIHTALSVRYLKASLKERYPESEVNVIEGNINQPLHDIVKKVYAGEPDIIGLSAYIFNIQNLLKIASDLKKILPKSKIVVGGPEVSYAVERYLKESPYLDFIISGEAEESFPSLIQALKNNYPIRIPGVWLLNESGELEGASHLQVKDLDELPSPYDDEMLSQGSGRIVYFESSRGCPFACSYCLSSAEKGVRYFSMERVKNDLTRLFQSDAKQVKFVDRTFNANPQRATSILEYIINSHQSRSYSQKNFHFEIAPDLFNDELFDIIGKAPAGLLQFEAGIQSFNEDALSYVNRKVDMEQAEANLRRLIKLGNVHVHVGLIAGLPGESLKSFKSSFNKAYKIEAHQLQLGFLKMLHGTSLRERSEEWGYQYSEYPPYQIVKTEEMTFADLEKLISIEELLDRLYNSGKFNESLKYLLSFFPSPFEMYESLNSFIQDKKSALSGCSQESLSLLLMQFLEECIGDCDKELLISLIAFDYLISTKTYTLPRIFRKYLPVSRNIGNLLKRREFIAKYLPHRIAQASSDFKDLYFQEFPIAINDYLHNGQVKRQTSFCLFDYSQKCPVTGRYYQSFIEKSSITATS